MIKKFSKKHQLFLSLIVILFFIIVITLIISTIFSTPSNGISKGVSIYNIDISNLSLDDARTKVNSELSKVLENTIKLKYGDYELELTSKEIDAKFNIENSLKEACNVNGLTLLFSSSLNYQPEFTYDQEKLNYILNDIKAKLPGTVVEPSYYIDNSNLIILKGSDGISLDLDQTKNLIISVYSNNNFSEISLPVVKTSASNINIDKIHNEIYTSPKDASIDKSTNQVSLEVTGVDFAISLDDAKQLLENYSEQYSIPLKYTPAKITVSDLGEDIFKNTISTFNTRYNTSNTDRTTNLELACKKINNTIIFPGETFSFNKLVGERTAAAGFKEAAVYANGSVEYGLGGGVCQISSTLYNATLLANLDIIERRNHSFMVSYVDGGRDATVAYGSIDFQFKNSRSYPIKIKADASNGIVTINILGLQEKNEYSVEIVTSVTEVIPFDIQYVKDSSLASGSQVVKQTGYDGCKCSAYKIVSSNGNVISKTLLSTDTYKAIPRIINANQ